MSPAWWATVKSLGYDRIEVEFSGGGDEGGADRITGIVCSAAGVETRSADLLDHAHNEDLLLPLENEYGGFAFEGRVNGVMTIDCVEDTITVSGYESMPQDFFRVL